MEIWIENEVGFLGGYSLTTQPQMVLVSVDRIPEDFTNWYFDGVSLTHRPETAPKIERYISPTEELTERTNMAEVALLELADIVLRGGE